MKRDPTIHLSVFKAPLDPSLCLLQQTTTVMHWKQQEQEAPQAAFPYSQSHFLQWDLCERTPGWIVPLCADANTAYVSPLVAR